MTSRGADSAGISAKFLQARIQTLSNALLTHFSGVLDPAPKDVKAPMRFDDENPPPLTHTAVEQLQLDVSSTALIRAAEDLMILTRTMKELWLFGGLNTIPEDNTQQDTKDHDVKRKMREDEELVLQGFLEYLKKMSESPEIATNGLAAKDEARS